MKKAKLIFILTSLAVSISGHAVSLQQSVIAARFYDTEFIAAGKLHDAEGQKRYQGFAGLLPEISLTGSYFKQDQPDASYAAGIKRHNYSFNLSQPLFDPARFATWKRADAAADLADANYMLAQQKLIQDVSKAWFSVIFARRQLATLQQEMKAYEVQLHKAQKAQQIGDGTVLDVDDAQASYDRARADMLSAEDDLNHASLDFNRLTGLPAEEIQEADLRCLFHPQKETMQQVVMRTAQKNLNIIAASHKLEETRADVISATSAHLPVVTLQANYGTNWSRAENENLLDEVFGSTSKTKNTYVGVNVTVPLFSGGKYLSQSFEAASRRDQARELLEDTRRKVVQDTKASWLGVNNNLAKINAYLRSVESAKKKVASTAYGKELGLRTLVDQFNAEKDLFKSRQDLTEAENNFVQQKIALAAATGDLDYSTLNNYACNQALSR